MQVFWAELVLFLPICLGRIIDNSSPQKIKDKVALSKDVNAKRVLKPSLSIKNGPQKVVEILAGNGKVLECEAGGSPPPTIHWLKDGKKIPQNYYEAVHPEGTEGEVISSRLGLGFTQSRLFIDCASSKDAGKYSCVAENEYFRDSETGQIYVLGAMDRENSAICLAKKTFGSPARIHMWTQNRLEIMGSAVQLFCRHGGDPQPEVTWRGPDGNILLNSEKYQTMENGDLIIRDLEWSDMGGYTCSVKNPEGSDEILVFLYPTLPDDKETKA